MSNEMVDRVAKAIEEWFLKDGAGIWDLDVIDKEMYPHLIPGRWLHNSDSNYSFRPVDVARVAIEAMREPTPKMVEVGSGVWPGHPLWDFTAEHWGQMIDAALTNTA